jgi:hypothetical protein
MSYRLPKSATSRLTIVVSQIIKDLLTGLMGGTLGQFDPGVDKILAEQKVVAILYRDAFTNKFRVGRFEYWDE